MDQHAQSKRLCFVTIGATAGFDDLIRASLSQDFLSALSRLGYTDLKIQYGTDATGVYEGSRKSLLSHAKNLGLSISGFSFNKQGLGKEFREAKGTGTAREGTVISHAGSGSILEGLRINVPVIVVPNPKLLDNHQMELAEELARQGYVVHGQLDNLPNALADVEVLRKDQQPWPPRERGGGSNRGLVGVMDDEMGFVD